ncbi:MAG: hypothetical protein PUH70_08695 [Clostridiales bacterium]|nr:hypothetical protein [Clostridiales bacterium]
MANIAISLLFQILFGKGGADMMAMLWAQQIMLGKKSFAQVPAKLREQVRELLVDSGVGELAE